MTQDVRAIKGGTPESPRGNDAEPGVAPHPPPRVVDAARLRHPTESTRFALALFSLFVLSAVALFAIFSLGEVAFLIFGLVTILLVFLILWVALQVWRIRLLGDAVLVSEDTLPELSAVVDEVRERLDYRRRLDVFVVDTIGRVLSGTNSPFAITSFFGIHVIIVEGDAVDDLSDERERKRVLFTLATYVGALKTRYAQWWSPLFTAFQMTGLAAFVWPFVWPYLRATVYTGDRIAYACCGDLDVSLQAVYRALVGKNLAPQLHALGLTEQALLVKRRLLLRFAQLLRPTPHATNRYLELLSFVKQESPDAFAAYEVSSLGRAGESADPVLSVLGRRRDHPAAPLLAVVLGIMSIVGGIFVGLHSQDNAFARALESVYVQISGDGTQASNSSDGGEPALPTVTEPSPPTAPSPDPRITAQLLAYLPEDVQGHCSASPPNAVDGSLGGLTCVGGLQGPEVLYVERFTDKEHLDASFESLAGNLPRGSCATLNHRTNWTYEGVTQGPLACFGAPDGTTNILWANTRSLTLALARNGTWTAEDAFTWWKNDGPTLNVSQ